MSLLNKIQQSLLNRSNSYIFYKNNYEKSQKQINNHEKKIDELLKSNKKYEKEIEQLKNMNQLYKEENDYLKSLLDFEIQNMKSYLYELIEMNNDEK